MLFALPDEAGRKNDAVISVPKLASLILTHDTEGEIRGLDQFEGRHPPVAPVFWAFRVMVGMGVLMLLTSWLAALKLRRGGSLSTWAARALLLMTFSGWLATLAGWYVTEIGRQPYLVSGLLLTRDAASATAAPIIGISLAMYLALYLLLIVSYVTVVFHLARKRAGMDEVHEQQQPGVELPA